MTKESKLQELDEQSMKSLRGGGIIVHDFNPQPEPPGLRAELNPQPEPPGIIAVL